MKILPSVLLLATACVVPAAALAKDATITVKMRSYSGPPSYMAIYVTDAKGKYQSTLYVAGGEMRYLRYLRSWYRAVSAVGSIDGVTGASVGSGQTLTIDVSIADALMDSGYEIRVDDAMEVGAEYPHDLVLPLKSKASDLSAKGTGYVQSLSVKM